MEYTFRISTLLFDSLKDAVTECSTVRSESTGKAQHDLTEGMRKWMCYDTLVRLAEQLSGSSGWVTYDMSDMAQQRRSIPERGIHAIVTHEMNQSEHVYLPIGEYSVGLTVGIMNVDSRLFVRVRYHNDLFDCALICYGDHEYTMESIISIMDSLVPGQGDRE